MAFRSGAGPGGRLSAFVRQADTLDDTVGDTSLGGWCVPQQDTTTGSGPGGEELVVGQEELGKQEGEQMHKEGVLNGVPELADTSLGGWCAPQQGVASSIGLCREDLLGPAVAGVAAAVEGIAQGMQQVQLQLQPLLQEFQLLLLAFLLQQVQ